MQFAKFLSNFYNDIRALVQEAPDSGVHSISITMVKNEQDIIETFLRTNRPYLDAMIVMDNGSIDETRRIAIDCARELGGIFVVDSPEDGFAQASQATAALRFVQSALFADHVFFLDCDEFLSAKNPADFRSDVSAEPAGTATAHAWQTYLPGPEQKEDDRDPMTTIRFVRRAEKPAFTKCVLHLGGAFSETMAVGKGAHKVRIGRDWMAAAARPDFPLIHIPVRSADQILAKALSGWNSAVIEKPSLLKAGPNYSGTSYHRRRLLDVVRDAALPLSGSAVASIAMSYAQSARTTDFMDNAQAALPKLDLARRYSDGFVLPAELSVFKTVMGKSALDYSGLLPPAKRGKGASNSAKKAADVLQPSNMPVDIAPFRFLAETVQPNSVLDIGCGAGSYLKLFEMFGATEILGVNGVDPAATVLGESQSARHDLRQRLELGRCFDLVMCLGLNRHLDAAAAEVFLDSMARHARDLIVFAVAEPARGMSEQSNGLTIDSILDLWARNGWAPQLIETLGLRAISTLSTFRRNLLVLRRAGPEVDGTAAAALRSIANLRYRPYPQGGGIRSAPFAEAYPAVNLAYGRVRPRPKA
ncbi:glycosyltransferase [Tabrizicola piscis]|uniref:Glycosyltransferase n=1 Tax=Tabrizicola piscis TaxID=2494374 RepID=A0A3S8U7H8_9RHOB|nr:glycosyltransferase family 2 protein [Tabrizicola piscis]AZL59533.1 glycosyltransferase [Tabrizicola piscis]